MKRLLEMEGRVRDLEARMSRVVCWGEVCETDPATAKVRVTLPDRDGVVSWWLPVLHHKTLQDKAYFMPDVGEQVVVCFPPVSGMETGFVIGATYNGQDTPPVSSQDKWHVLFKDGSWLEYDRAEHNLSGHIKGKVDDFTVDGDVNVNVGGNVNAEVGGNVNASVGGSLAADVGSNATVNAGSKITLKAPSIGIMGNVSSSNQSGGTGSETKKANTDHTGSYVLNGNLTVNGSISASGNILAGGSNSNHHSH